MALELHVWGAAFGLPSIDPECLAATALLSIAATPRSACALVTTSPSAVPHTLPALRDGRTGRWIAAGYDAIVAYVKKQAEASTAVTTTDGPLFRDVDAGLTSVQTADAAAYAAFLRAEAAPLVALSLYVSSANWAAATRPAYSRILPFPLAWIEPPAVRASRAASAAHLGFSSLDTDTDGDDDEDGGGGALSGLSAALHSFPDRLRQTVDGPRPSDRPSSSATQKLKGGTQTERLRAAAGALSSSSRVSQSLTPEAKAQIRLDGAARACLSVLSQQKGDKRLFLRAASPPSSSPTAAATSLDCLALGYLALMAVPDVPRPFLRDALRRHHPELAVFVADMRAACFGTDRTGDKDAAPSKNAHSVAPRGLGGPYPLWLRTLHGAVHSLPGIGGESTVWFWHHLRAVAGDDIDGDGFDETMALWGRPGGLQQARRHGLLAVSGTVVGLAFAVSLVLGYRRLPAFGSPLLVYQRAPSLMQGINALMKFM